MSLFFAEKRPVLVGLACLVITPHLAPAQTPTPSASDLPPQATPMAQVLVPVPTKVFATLDKFSNCNWRLVQMNGLSHARAHGDETQLALLLGLTIGEGFIAVEAHDKAEVKEIGSAVLTLARGVGVQPVVMRRSRGIMEFAEKEDWPAVRKEWDAVMPEVEEGMKQIKSEQLAQLVSLGGWLRGARALSSLILQHYSATDADWLRQGALLDRFEKQLSGMAPNARISKMREGVRRMRDLVDGDKPISEQSVKDLSALCDELIKSIVTADAHP